MTRLLLLLLLLPAVAVHAQDEDLPPDEIADLVDRYVDRGEESLREGNYDEAVLRFRKALRRDPAHRAARLGVVSSLRARGRYEQAERELSELLHHHPADRLARVVKGEIDLLRGRDASAREAARQVVGTGGEGPDAVGRRARLLLARALAESGKRDEARTVLDFFLDRYDDRYDDLSRAAVDSEDLRGDPARGRPVAREMTDLAVALRLYVELSPLDFEYAENALELVGYAREIDPMNWDAWVEYVRITRFQPWDAMAKARKALALVEKRNPEIADLYVEAARSISLGFNESEVRSLARKALVINPNHADAHALLARVMLTDNEYAPAQEHLEKGLAVNPRHRDLLALKATLDLLLGDREGFEQGMKRALEVDPTYGEAFHLAGLVVAGRQRRYDRAVELVRRGLQLDPLNHRAQATLGIFLANLGRAEEALEILGRAQKAFPFDHPVRDNFRKVLRHVTGTMTEHRTDHFVVRMDPSEHELLAPFLPPLLEECWADMVERYGFTPRAPVLVEVFSDADDFSVRTLGLPGIPALGACFGGLITLDSPRALPPGQFLWAATARHEFAHVMSLQLSGGQVPRWFTEGLSVLEEAPLDTGWGQAPELERQLYDAYHAGDLPRIATFDAMFRSPRVGWAYHVAGHMVDMLRRRSGEEGIVKALRLWGRDTPMQKVFREAFGLELSRFDELFREFVGERTAGWRLQPRQARWRDRLQERAFADPSDGEVLLRLAWAYYERRGFIDAGGFLEKAEAALGSNHHGVLLLRMHLDRVAGRDRQMREWLQRFFAAGGEEWRARMIQAGLLTRDGKEAEAVAALDRAKADWPLAVGPGSPYHLLYQAYQRQEREAEALAELEAHAKLASRSIPLRRELARAYLRAGRRADAVRVLEETLRITLYDPGVHRALMPLYRGPGDAGKRVRSARFLVHLLPDDVDDETAAAAWLDLAEALIDDGKEGEAREALKKAAELHEEAPRIRKLRERLEEKPKDR
ncbi:MAG: tetratricopeptide repeat protein [Planctomycetota bacterium]